MNEFIFAVQIFTDDTDYSGVVYHANYLKYMEHARSALAWKSGFGLDELAKQKIYFAVRNISVEYLFPARIHDELEVVTRIEKVGHTSIVFQQDIRLTKNPQQMITKGQVILVCINELLKPRKLPEKLIDNLHINI